MDDRSPRLDRDSHPASEEQSRAAAELLVDSQHQPALAAFTRDTGTAYPRDRCVHELVAEQAAQRPDAIALIYGDAQLTYGELDRRANRLAHHLQALGVGADGLVGLCLERSIDLVISMLAVLKAGGAYVPFDPSYPAERIQFMLDETRTPVVLTTQRLAALLPSHAGQTIELDAVWPALARLPETAPAHRATAEHLAYVMYTSGSTGRPKGISIPHRGITRLVCNTNYLQLTPADRVIQASNTAFDAATFEIWGALINGARVVGADRETALVPERFAALLREQQITAAFMTTAWFNQVVNLNPEAFAGLRALLFGGEACDPARVRQVLRTHPSLRLLHVYGPTESTTFASWYPVTTVAADATTVPIGYPLANTQLYLLDAQLQPVPIGVSGELYIGGDGLAHGYLNHPALTADKFVPDPFGEMSGGRLYKTGDLGRAQADGAIEFMGRVDDQIKLRGFRIELGEIEAVLRQHPQVRDGVVLAREDNPGDMRLVAYVVGEQENKRTREQTETVASPSPVATGEGVARSAGDEGLTSTLRSYLQDRLPAYMVPSAFVILPALPLTPNGKVDRRALPAPDWSERAQGEHFVAPRTPTEELLAQIWAEVLHLEQIGIHDNVLELGSHSLLATQVVSRIRSTLQIDLPLVTLFEAPTIAELAQHVEAMRDGGAADALTLVPRPRDGELPLSFAQQRVWFFDQWLPNNPAYNLPFTYRLSGPLRVDALQASLSAILRRHDALRTNFVAHNGQPAQVIRPASDLAMPLVDLRTLPADERETAAQRLLSEEAHRPFDLQSDLLIRALLLRLADDEHILLLTIHHIIFDGWSEGVMLRELTALYAAHSADQPAQLPDLPIQYVDFSLWQRELLQGAVLHRQLDYWRQQLTGVPVLDLPTDYPRPATLTFNGTQERFLLPPSLSARLHTLSRQEGVTLFMTLLAAFQVLLARYTGQHDIAVGSPIANRNRAEIEGLIGFFVNTLVLRSDLSGNPPFRTLLRRVRDTALGAYAHQDVPFEHVLEAVQPERDLSFTPLFQVMFVLQNAPTTDLALPGVQAKPIDVVIQNARFDLTVMLRDTSAGLVGQIEYNTNLFTAATMQRLAGHFQAVLERVVAEPDQRIGWLPLLSEAEQQLLRDWNATTAPYPAQATTHQLFEAQVARAPDAPAVVWVGSGAQEHTLSYAELNRQANQLAHYLQARGVGPEICVGVCLERSTDLIVALLAVLKAGGVYLPLDPAYPTDRLQFMLADAQVQFLITEQRFSGSLPDHGAQVIWLDGERDSIAQESADAPHTTVTPRNLAYVIYTSGSTGRPKGVPIEHQGIANVAQAQVEVYGVGPGDRVLQSAALSFDASLFEIFMALLSGATLYLAPSDDLMPGPALSELLRKTAITNMTLTPSALSALPPDAFPALRTVIAVGEASSADLVKRWAIPERNFFNGYGPTEVTIWATTALCQPEVTPPPIGRPMSNKRVYLLDAYGQPVPVGVPGEICIAGVGLARGYLNRPDLTATQFIPDAFGDEPGARLYRSGDLARYRPDGQIEYLGRIDHQVKIRGFRIELGEIEAVLHQHPAIAEAVVVAREDEIGKRLVAYVVEEQTNKETKEQSTEALPSPTADAAEARRGVGQGGQGGEGLTSTLRAFLKERLPDYMVPSVFMVLDALPMTANGKLNRRALPAPSTDRPTLASTFVAPRTALETILSGYWTEVLRLQQVGVHDNFFDLGGHSLLATQITSRISQAFQVPFPVPRLFEAPTVAGLAERLIADEPKPGQMEKIAQLLQRIKQMSPDARRNALHQKKAQEERS